MTVHIQHAKLPVGKRHKPKLVAVKKKSAKKVKKK